MRAGKNNRIAETTGGGEVYGPVTRECGVPENIPYMQEIFNVRKY
jgi:hypothetical protein